MALYLHKDKNVFWNGTSNKATTPALCYYQNNATNYLPLITKDGKLTLNNKIWSYTTAVPTFHIIYNSTEYVVPNKVEAAVNYDIPEGTYSPSKFKSLIDNYISLNNGSRRVSNSFTATVNGQTITVKANTTIYNVNNSGSGSRTLSYGVNFSGSYMQAGSAFSSGTANSFINNKVYITESRGISYLANYKYYNIRIGTGIKFK